MQLKIVDRVTIAPQLAQDTPAAATSPIVGGYTNHVSSCVDGAGNIFIAATQVTTGPDQLIIRRRDAKATTWATVAVLTEGMIGKPGYSALEVIGSQLILIASVRTPENEQVLQEIVLEAPVGADFVIVPPVARGDMDIAGRVMGSHRDALKAAAKLFEGVK